GLNRPRHWRGGRHARGSSEEAVVFADLGLEIWGRPHRDYGDMIPFERLRPRSTRWQIAVAHGHYVPLPESNHPAASVLAHRRRRAQGAPTTSRSGTGIARRRSEPLPPIIPAHPNPPARQRGAVDRDRRGRGHARRARHCARALGRRLAARAARENEMEVRMGCRLVSLALAFAAGLTAAALGTAAQSQTPPGTWTQKAPMPAVRGGVAAAAGGDKLFAPRGGGSGGGGPREQGD